MYCLVSPEKFVPHDHPLRAIKPFVDEALRELSSLFDAMYADIGRPSIPPERLLKAKLLQAFYTIRSENLLVESRVQRIRPWNTGEASAFAGAGKQNSGDVGCESVV